MSVVTGIINNGEIIISADTLLAHLSDSDKNKDGFSKIYKFTLGQNVFLIGAGGTGEDLSKFVEKIQKHPFPMTVNDPESFSNELQNLLKNENLNHLTLLVGGRKGTDKLISRIKYNEKQTIKNNGEYLTFFPDSVQKSLPEIKKIIDDNSSLLPEEPLIFLRKLQQKVAQIDNFRYVNDDFYYAKIKKDCSVESADYSDKGYKMK